MTEHRKAPRPRAQSGQHPLLPAVIASVFGALFAGLLVGIHTVWRLDGLTEILQIPLPTARPLLAGLSGTIVTVIAVLFWIRSSAVQLAAFQFPAHLMQRYLADRWQQGRMAFVVGTFCYLVVATWLLPGDETEPVPHLAVLGGLVLVLFSIFAVIASVAASARFVFVSEISGRLGARLVAQIRQWDRAAERNVEVGDLASPSPDDSRTVPSTRSGWLCGIDDTAILRALPERTTVWVEARIGSFVMEGEPLATIRARDDVDPEVGDAVRDAVEIGSSRNLETDLEYGIQLLADAAFRSLSRGNDDITGATEGIYQLGVVMRELIVSGAPSRISADGRGRRLVRKQDLSAADHTRRVLEHLDNDAIAHSAGAVEATIDVLGRMATLEEQDDSTSEMITALASRLLDRCRESGASEGTLDELLEHARVCGLTT